MSQRPLPLLCWLELPLLASISVPRPDWLQRCLTLVYVVRCVRCVDVECSLPPSCHLRLLLTGDGSAGVVRERSGDEERGGWRQEGNLDVASGLRGSWY